MSPESARCCSSEGRPPDALDEDLLDRRLGDLEVRHRVPAGERGPEDRLRVDVASTSSSVASSPPARRGPPGSSASQADRAARVRARRHRSTPRRTTRRPVERLTSRIGPPSTSRPRSISATASHSSSTISIWWVEKISVVPPLAHLGERLLEQRDVHRVEPDERLVHDHDRRLVEDRGDQLDLLLVALRELLGPALLVVGDAEAGEPLPCARGRDVARDAVQRREEHELVEHLEARIQPALLRQVAPRLARARRSSAVPAQVAVPESGRMMSSTIRIVVVLPAPLAPRNPNTWPARHLERDPVEGRDRAEALDQAVEDEAHAGQASHAAVAAACRRTDTMARPARDPPPASSSIHLTKAGEFVQTLNEVRAGAAAPATRPRRAPASRGGADTGVVTFPSKATHQQTRAYNAALVLRALYDHGPISRAEVARMTGLTRTTVGEVVGELIDGRDGARDRARPVDRRQGSRSCSSSSTTRATSIGLDLGEFVFRGGARRPARARSSATAERQVDGLDGDQALDVVHELIDELAAAARRRSLGIGVGTPGIVDAATGTIRSAVNLDWQDLPLGEILARALRRAGPGRERQPRRGARDRAVRDAHARAADRRTSSRSRSAAASAPAWSSAASCSTATASARARSATRSSRTTAPSLPLRALRLPRDGRQLRARSLAPRDGAGRRRARTSPSGRACRARGGDRLTLADVRDGDRRTATRTPAGSSSRPAATSARRSPSLIGVLDVERIVLHGSVATLGGPWLDAVRDEAAPALAGAARQRPRASSVIAADRRPRRAWAPRRSS